MAVRITRPSSFVGMNFTKCIVRVILLKSLGIMAISSFALHELQHYRAACDVHVMWSADSLRALTTRALIRFRVHLQGLHYPQCCAGPVRGTMGFNYDASMRYCELHNHSLIVSSLIPPHKCQETNSLKQFPEFYF